MKNAQAKQLMTPPPVGPPAVATARLKVLKGPYKGVSYKIVAGKITIGRSSENDIALENDKKCSRKQAVISLGQGGSYSIKDLSNRASLKVNNLAKIQSDLQDGDLIQFGATVLQFEHKAGEFFAGSAASAGAGGASAGGASAGGSSPAVGPPAVAGPSSVGGVTPLPSSAPGAPVPLPLPSGGHSAPPVPGTPESANSDLPGLKAQGDLSQDQPFNPAFSPSPYAQHTPASFPSSQQKKQKRALGPKIILLVIALLAVFLFFSEDGSSKKEREDQLRTIMEREKDVQTLTELKEKEQEKRKKNNLSSYKSAQFAYIIGIRDYRKGVYSRAIESFRVCKTLYPEHELCSSYLRKAQVKNQQLIQAWMIAGKDYREKRRFVPCMSSFKNVMMAVRDKQNITYKEALENYKICQIKYKDRY